MQITASTGMEIAFKNHFNNFLSEVMKAIEENVCIANFSALASQGVEVSKPALTVNEHLIIMYVCRQACTT